jgi:hypothetical protein
MERPKTRITAIMVVFLLWPLYILPQENNNLYICINGNVNFISDAPMELIKASNNNLAGVLNITDRSFSFQIPVKGFEGFNSSLQKTHFNEDYMETEQYSYSTFKGRIIEETDISVPGQYRIRAKGKLSIHGVEIDRIIRCDLTVTPGKIDVASDFTVFIADHNISIPSILNQKIATEIKVSVRFSFVRSGT